jgi:predicted thioesterase
MKTIFKPGDKKIFRHVVKAADTAGHDPRFVHQVYATFNIARDAEWCGRLFVLDMKEENEEGLGTFISVHHHGPAFPGEEIVFTAELEEINGPVIKNSFQAHAGNRLIATGRQVQQILPIERVKQIFDPTKISPE